MNSWKLLTLLSALLLPLQSFAESINPAETEIPSDEPARMLKSVKESVFEKDRLDDQYPPAFWLDREDPKKPQLTPINLASLSSEMNFISKTINVEEATKTPRKWFADIAEALDKLYSARAKMENALTNKRRSEYFSAYSTYARERNGLDQLLSERPTLSPGEYKRAKDEANLMRNARDKAKQPKQQPGKTDK